MTTSTQLSAEAPTVGTRPEVELLICCTRTCVDPEIVERIENLLQSDIDWNYLIQTAFSHGVMPLLYWNLNATYPEAVPKVILDKLRDYFHNNARHNLFLSAELLKLLNLFKVHGISAIPFKGPVLAASVYGNLALRQFCDLDILIHERDFLRAKDLLLTEGYQPQHDLGWEHHFMHQGSKVNVDLHQAITWRYFSFPLNFKRLWSRLEPISLAGTMVSNLLPEDLLLILCVNWGRDCYKRRERLAQLCDIAELLRVYPKLDWLWILEQARTLGSERMLLLALFLTSDLLGAALPQAVLNRLQPDPVVKSLAEQVRSQLWCEKDLPRDLEETSEFFSSSYEHRFYLKMRERLLDRVTYCLYFALIPNQKDQALLPLPKVFFFLYYPLHLIRLAGKYGLGLLRNFLEI